MNILVINHSTESCGVHQYGKRVGKILEKSKENNFFYYELESHRELDEKNKTTQSSCNYLQSSWWNYAVGHKRNNFCFEKSRHCATSFSS